MKNQRVPGLIMFFIVLMFLFSYLTEAAAQTEGCPSGISHYWKMDGSSSPYADFYGANAAVCTNCPTATTGVINGAQQFSAESLLSVVDDNTFDWGLNDSFSIEFWMNNGSCTTTQVMIGRNDGGTPMLWYAACTAGKVEVYFSDAAGNISEATGTTDIANGSWHHIVAVMDTGTNELRVYVNGAIEQSVATAFSGGFSSSAPLNIGWLNLADGYHFSGTLDEVSLYNRVLSESEIRQHHRDGSIGLGWGYCGCASPARIMPLGDSITYGEPPDDPILVTGYRKPLYQTLFNSGYSFDFVGSLQHGDSASFDIDHEGHGGWGAKADRGYGGGIAPTVQQFLTDHPADVVLLHIGTNDISDGTQNVNDIAEILDNIDLISENIVVVLGLIINRTDGTDKVLATTQFNDEVEAMATARIAAGDRIIIVDHETALNYATDLDGTLHPNAAGYAKMAGVWSQALSDILPLCGETAPLIVSAANTAAYDDWPYFYDVAATGFPSPTFSLVTAPSTMTINSSTGLISWIPSSTGNYNVSVKASNTQGDFTQNFTIQVGDPWACSSEMMSHYWKFGEAAGPTYEDVFGFSDATCTNCPTAAPGIIGNAQQFDSASELNADLGDTANWGINDSFSVEFWMKTADCSGTRVLAGRNDTSTSLHWYVACTDGSMEVFVRDTGGVSSDVVGIRNIADDSWHHVAAVREAATKELSIYVDGKRENSVRTSFKNGFTSTVPFNIGWINMSHGYHFTGILDALALYNKALSDEEVLQHYHNGTIGTGYCNEYSYVTPSVGSNGSISPATKQKVKYNRTIAFTVTPNNGYHINSVTGCNGTLVDNTYTTGPITADCNVIATFAFGSATNIVTPSAGAHGSVTPSVPQTVNYNGTVSFTVTPDTGYHLVSVTGCGGTLVGDTYTTGPIIADCGVSASFAINTYTVTPSAGANGSISPNTAQMVNYNDTISFTVTPAAGGHLVSVTGCSGTLEGDTYTTGPVTADCAVAATFEINGTVKKVSGSAVSYFSSLQAAYDVASSGDSIQSQETTLIENIDFAFERVVTVQGGYDQEFSIQNGPTTVSGTLTISSGTVVLDNLAIQ